MADAIRIVEVGPRDGLQNESVSIPTSVKLRMIEALARAGLREIEAASFVSPNWVPQLADAAELWPQLPAGPLYSALTPNQKGLERALASCVRRIAVFTAASDAFTRRNINMPLDESLRVFAELIPAFKATGPDAWVRAYVSTAIECPYAGRIAPAAAVAVAERLLKSGADEISMSDTTGTAVPGEVAELGKALLDVASVEQVAFHFHDTYGTAVANVAKALEMGFRTFDSSAGGLGGCPYAPGAAGNLATEDLTYFLERNGIATGIDLTRLALATSEVLSFLGRGPGSKAQLAQLSASGTSPR